MRGLLYGRSPALSLLATLALITTTSLMTAGAVPAAATPVATRTGAGASTSLPLKNDQARAAAIDRGALDVTAATKKAVLINENVARLTGRETTFDLKSTDWKLAVGHLVTAAERHHRQGAGRPFVAGHPVAPS